MHNKEVWVLVIVCVVVYAIFALALIYLKNKLKTKGTIRLAILIPVIIGFVTGVSMLLYAISSL